MSHSQPETEQAAFRWFIAEKLNRFLEENPRITLQELGVQLDVAASTISRWRTAQSVVGLNHRDKLFNLLGITSKDLDRANIRPPSIRTRGAVRTRGGAPMRFPATVPAAQFSAEAPPTRIVAVLLQPGIWPRGLGWLKALVAREVSSLEAFFSSQPLQDGTSFRFGSSRNIVLSPSGAKRDAVGGLLRALQATVELSELALFYVWSPIEENDNGCRIALQSDESLAVAELLTELSQIQGKCLAVIEGYWPEDGKDKSPGEGSPRLESELRRVAERTVPLVTAALPQQQADAAKWPFFSRLLQEFASNPAADCNGDERLDLGELCGFAVDQIRPRNDHSLLRISSGKSGVVVPLPRPYGPEGCERTCLGHREETAAQSDTAGD